jgi:hypothetical protein
MTVIGHAPRALAADITATAQTYDDPELHYTQNNRISILGGAGTIANVSKTTTTDGATPQSTAADGGILFDFGRSKWGFQTGLMYLNVPAVITATAPDGTNETTTTNLGYLGLPLLLRYNYIEHPMAVFSVKGGVMPAYIVTPETTYGFGDPQDPNYAQVDIKTTDVMVLAGFTGTGPITPDVGFLIDATVFYGMIPIDGIARNEGVLLSAGFTFGL